MLRIFTRVIALAIFVAPAFAQVTDGSLWTYPDGTSAVAGVADLPGGGHRIQTVDASGFSTTNNAWGTPPVQQSGNVQTPGAEYRANGGKLEKKIGDTWVKGRKVKRPPVNGKPGRRWTTTQLLGTSVWSSPSSVPFSGPGDDVTSLPDPRGWIVGH